MTNIPSTKYQQQGPAINIATGQPLSTSSTQSTGSSQSTTSDEGTGKVHYLSGVQAAAITGALNSAGFVIAGNGVKTLAETVDRFSPTVNALTTAPAASWLYRQAGMSFLNALPAGTTTSDIESGIAHTTDIAMGSDVTDALTEIRSLGGDALGAVNGHQQVSAATDVLALMEEGSAAAMSPGRESIAGAAIASLSNIIQTATSAGLTAIVNQATNARASIGASLALQVIVGTTVGAAGGAAGKVTSNVASNLYADAKSVGSDTYNKYIKPYIPFVNNNDELR